MTHSLWLRNYEPKSMTHRLSDLKVGYDSIVSCLSLIFRLHPGVTKSQTYRTEILEWSIKADSVDLIGESIYFNHRDEFSF